MVSHLSTTTNIYYFDTFYINAYKIVKKIDNLNKKI